MIRRLHQIARAMAVLLVTLLAGQLAHQPSARAGGISIDAGLTPAANRWIFRSQMRLLQRGDHPSRPAMEMEAYMFPVMAAYGLRSDAMIMVRQAYMRREMTMMSGSSRASGFGDLFILGKYRLLRVNTPTNTLGIAPTLGLELPTGESGFSSESYDLQVGTFFSGRMHRWRMDLNLAYIWNGMALTGDTNIDPGDEIAIKAAISRQFSVEPDAGVAIAPVLESSYQKMNADDDDGATISNTGGSLFMLAPGLKLTRGSFVLEGLVQFPVWQEYEGSQTDRQTSFLLGFRLMS